MQRLGGTFASGVAALALPSIATAVIKSDGIRAVTTNLTSNADRIVSYRHQEHMWQTSDGGLHLVINRGTQPGDPPGLCLYSSFDGGVGWVLAQSFPGTDDKSTSDGQLHGDDLLFAYATAGGDVIYSPLHYDSVLRTWSVVAIETAFSSTVFTALNPAIAVDALGTVWCAFVSRNRSTNDVNIRMVDRVGGGNVWSDPNLIFGPTDRRSIERSARPVRTPNGMGMVFTVRESTFWAFRTNGFPDNSSWSVSTVYVGTADQSWKDPYASHFGVVTDDQNNMHLVLADNYDIFYLRSTDAGNSWSAPLRVDDDRKVVYAQVGLVNGKIAVPFSAQRGKSTLMCSSDLGASFTLSTDLLLLPASPGVDFGQARVEMPTRSTGALPVLQQYSDNGVQRLMLFVVPSP
jgi:hypothetical protein